MEDLAVVGVHAVLFDDDTAAAFANSTEALLPWSHDSEVLIDRYDVRHLLEDFAALHPRRGASTPSPQVSEDDLDLERYRDLQTEEDHSGSSVSGQGKRDHGHLTSGYHNVPFDYGGGTAEKSRSVSPPPPPKKAKEEPVFHPAFPVPDHLHEHLPPTEKAHQIISGTAKFVSGRGGQAEIILRVKQANNPTFGFLMPDHNLHPYFRYLVDHPELTVSKPASTEAVTANKPADGLKLLGQAYGEDDEEAGESPSRDAAAAPQKPLPLTVEIKTIKEPPASVKSVIDKMVEFIARNGKEFEDVVKERDKSDERFHFLHPRHEFHPYYLSMLGKADQTRGRRRSSH